MAEERGMADPAITKMARELDEMTRDVTSEEADLLEKVLRKMKEKRPLSPGQSQAIKKMYDKYLTSREGAQETDDDEEVEEEELE
jgi:hypothetical protein